MTELVALTQRELKRAQILGFVVEGHLSLKEAAEQLSISVRQARRLVRRYEENGAEGLAHGNRGRGAPNQISEEVRSRILSLVETKYTGFNDTHLHEVLCEHEGFELGRETLRRLLREAGIGPKRRRRSRKHRRRRTPRSQRGMMIQWDGSPHRWLGPTGPWCVLMAAVDDSDGKIQSAVFVESETSAAYLRLLDGVLGRAGIPQSIYQDRHSALRRNDGHWSLSEQLSGEQDPTQVGAVLKDLSIRPIFARSPQGKGRIERFFGVAQDRLCAELSHRKIQTLEAANRYLREEWMSSYNRKFGRAPREMQSAYRNLVGVDRHKTITFRYSRVVASDNTVTLGSLSIQIPPGPRRRSYAKAKVDVRQHLDGSWSVYYQDQRIAQHEPTPFEGPERHRIKTRRSRPAKGASESVELYWPGESL